MRRPGRLLWLKLVWFAGLLKFVLLRFDKTKLGVAFVMWRRG